MKTAIATTAIILALASCTPAQTKAEEADVSYKAQQVACVDKYSTRPEIDACRDKVKAAWSTVDAGSEGGK